MSDRGPVLLVLLGLIGCGGTSRPGSARDASTDSGGGDSSSRDSAAVDSGRKSDAASDGPRGCSSTFTDPQASARTACTFAVGAKVADTIGFTAADRAAFPISHVIVMMKENRSFDMMLGQLAAYGRPGVQGPPAGASNPDAKGMPVAPFHQTNTCLKDDPSHQFVNMHNMYDKGKMDGFVTNAAATSSPASDGHFVMGYFTPTEIPFYFWLANQYPVADAFHCSALSGTWSNRDYLLLGSSYGVEDTGQIVTGLLGATTIFDERDAAKISWGVYTDDSLGPFEDALAQDGWIGLHSGVYTNTQFMSDLMSGKLPSVAFVDSKANVEDEHPPADVQVGEAWTKSMYDAVIASPIWLDSAGKGVALFFTYDESGGFYDHAVPPPACLASPDQSQFDTLGFRVPMILVSPFARMNYVSHLVHQHTSILRFIELLFDLPALTGRDANSDALLDMFDTGGPAGKPPVGEPAAGTGACK